MQWCWCHWWANVYLISTVDYSTMSSIRVSGSHMQLLQNNSSWLTMNIGGINLIWCDFSRLQESIQCIESSRPARFLSSVVIQSFKVGGSFEWQWIVIWKRKMDHVSHNDHSSIRKKQQTDKTMSRVLHAFSGELCQWRFSQEMTSVMNLHLLSF